MADHHDNEVHSASTGMDPYLIAQAQQAQAREKSLGFRAVLRNFGPGIFFSMMLSVALSKSTLLYVANEQLWKDLMSQSSVRTGGILGS